MILLNIIQYFVYFSILLLIVFILRFIYKKNYIELFSEKNYDKIPGKTIWLLWLQGWDNAPWYIHKIKESWIRYNPEWNIELVSEDNLSNYLPNLNLPAAASPASKSDIIRLNLLYEHGGVWADATMLCMMPLDLWVYDVLQPSGFWMYSGYSADHTTCLGPASWFIISMKKSIIISKWKLSCDEYWKDKTEAHTYFWLDELFNNLLINDAEFALEWEKVPKLCCEDPGQAHMLAGKCSDNNPDLKDIIKNKPPFAIKLTRHSIPNELTDDFKNTNMYYAIDIALNRDINTIFTLPEIKYPAYINIINKDKVVVIADCNHTEILDLIPICNDNNIQMIVYDKCNFGENLPRDIYCRPLKNVGRDAGTFIYFMIQNYDYLPETIYLLPGNIKKHERKQRFIDMINNDNLMGSCQKLAGSAEFTLDKYEEIPLKPASHRPFKTWFETYVGQWNDNDMGPCWNCVMHTNRDRIKKHSKESYINIYNQLIQDNNLEVVHYIERSMAAIF